jgi:hypothetical protein
MVLSIFDIQLDALYSFTIVIDIIYSNEKVLSSIIFV